jgi:FAD:protein FMN transferase
MNRYFLRRVCYFGITALAAAVIWLLWDARENTLIELEARPPGIMGTEVTIKAVVPARDAAQGQEALRRAEAKLREVEDRMSVWLGTSELSRFNASPPGELVSLSAGTLDLLSTASEFTRLSEGAFDVTCRALLEVWRQAEARDRLPSAEELEEARGKTGWRWIRLHSAGAERLHPEVTVDPGGIGKGYAVDLAVAEMEQTGVSGGLVQGGGEIRVFGFAERRKPWRIALQDPSGRERPGALGTIVGTGLAVSTSGDYERYYTVEGKRYSHIIDPRSGMAVDAVPQATVVAASATLSDGWSTALSVLGPAGLELLPAGVEALLVTGEGEQRQVHQTPGFARLLDLHHPR